MGDPLFSYAAKTGALKSDAKLGGSVNAYVRQAQSIREDGLRVEQSGIAQERNAYLGELRSLQKTDDRPMVDVKREVLSAQKSRGYEACPRNRRSCAMTSDCATRLSLFIRRSGWRGNWPLWTLWHETAEETSAMPKTAPICLSAPALSCWISSFRDTAIIRKGSCGHTESRRRFKTA